jgi:hypothetical protein
MQRLILGLLALVVVAGATAGAVVALSPEAPSRWEGGALDLGNGTVAPFVTRTVHGIPEAVGVTFSAGAFEALPDAPNHHSRCFDVNGDGAHGHHECIGDEERALDLPDDLVAELGLPFTWMAVNWNAHGHPAPYDKPHFDVHFHRWTSEQLATIRPGKCGELVDCEDFERAMEPVPAAHLPRGHISVGAVVAGMGNHLLDASSPELATPAAPFTRTFIYGAFGGELIFWEPMITHEFLRSTEGGCWAIAQPDAYATPGHYPTRYCIRVDAASGARSITLEGFVHSGER